MIDIEKYVDAINAVIKPLKAILSRPELIAWVKSHPTEMKADLERCERTIAECNKESLRKFINGNQQAIAATDELRSLATQYRKELLGYNPAN